MMFPQPKNTKVASNPQCGSEMPGQRLLRGDRSSVCPWFWQLSREWSPMARLHRTDQRGGRVWVRNVRQEFRHIPSASTAPGLALSSGLGTPHFPRGPQPPPPSSAGTGKGASGRP